tara:strand:- start:1305 stop:2102 length:798 start_codon:yes stop_codon:yes gene_type:complete
MKGVPVLLQQGYPLVTAAGGGTATSNFRLTTDRGYSKFFDIYSINNTTAGLEDNCQATLNVGGQNLVQDTNLPYWSSTYQYGRDHKFRIRAEFSDGQTGTLDLNGGNTPNSAVEQTAQAIVYYCTREHATYLNNFRLKFGQGLKRRQYYHVVPSVATTNNISQSTFTAPRNNGPISAIAVTTVVPLVDGVAYPNDQQHRTLVTIIADGIEIIKDVSSTYYQASTGRDEFIQPISIDPGATFTIQTTTGLATTTPFQVYLTLFFDN